MVFDQYASARKMYFWKMLSVTLTFEPMTMDSVTPISYAVWKL